MFCYGLFRLIAERLSVPLSPFTDWEGEDPTFQFELSGCWELVGLLSSLCPGSFRSRGTRGVGVFRFLPLCTPAAFRTAGVVAWCEREEVAILLSCAEKWPKGVPLVRRRLCVLSCSFAHLFQEGPSSCFFSWALSEAYTALTRATKLENIHLQYTTKVFKPAQEKDEPTNLNMERPKIGYIYYMYNDEAKKGYVCIT